MIRSLFAACVLTAAIASVLGAAALPENSPLRRTPDPVVPVNIVPSSTLPSILEEIRTADQFHIDTLSFAVRFHGEVSPYRVLGVFVLPGERVSMKVHRGSPGPYVGLADAGVLVSIGESGWEWEAPASPGLHHVAVMNASTGEAMLFNAFVVVPHEQVMGGTLNGYHIGEYPGSTGPTGDVAASTPAPNYGAPLGYIEITPENENTAVSPHFRLKQFVCKQQPGTYPRYVVLRERLLLKLERLLALVNESGVPAQSFHVMSGYRTPHYNAAIGNVKMSRHQFGDAADIFIDENGDGVMDDVNGDRRVDLKDSDWLRALVDRIHGSAADQHLVGGVGLYNSTAEHGPFVHVDTRGRLAQW